MATGLRGAQHVDGDRVSGGNEVRSSIMSPRGEAGDDLFEAAVAAERLP